MYSHSGDMATEDFVYEPVASAELRLRSNLPEEPLDEYQGPPETVSFAVDFAAGLAGGCAGLVFGHPFDTVKVRQQTAAAGRVSMLQCFKSTVQTNGIHGLFRGMAFPLVAVGALNSIFFGVYGTSMKLLCRDEAPTYTTIFLAGGFAGTVQAIPACPMELVKVKLQTENKVSGARSTGPMSCLQAIYREEGVRGCFRGLSATMLRELPGFSVYITSYQAMCDAMAPEPGTLPSVPGLLMAGGLAGVFSWILNIPIDIIKSRLQVDNPANPQYRGFIDCARKSYQQEGFRVFWRGLPVSCLRAFPSNAVTFTVYSTVLKTLQSDQEQDSYDQ